MNIPSELLTRIAAALAAKMIDPSDRAKYAVTLVFDAQRDDKGIWATDITATRNLKDQAPQ